jgi:DNA-binding HxlR family transcriptional regulator
VKVSAPVPTTPTTPTTAGTRGPLAAWFPDGVFASDCPSRVVLDHVMSKWGTLVLLALADGDALRWTELRRRAQGVSEKMLAQTLRTLEADGLVHRDAKPVVPPHVEYSLTPLGRGLTGHLVPLMAWVAEHAPDIVDREAAAPARTTRQTSAQTLSR